MTGCLLPAVFAAQSGVGQLAGLHVPQGMDVMERPPPPFSEKVVLGEPLANRFDTDNFTIQWANTEMDAAPARVASEALEAAWEVLVEQENLGPPRTGEWAKILVILDPELSGTGVTTGDETDENPEAAPIIYLNPNYMEQPDFFRSLAVHEFGHALQFKFRDWYGASASEPWFWEATSEWMTEVVNSDWNQYAWSASWYAAAPDLPFDSMVDFHQYGMMLLNAYMDQYRGGAQTIWSIWTDNEGRDWLDEIEDVVQEPAIRLWGDFVGAYAAGALVDSAYYETPIVSPQSGEIVGELGSAYVVLEEGSGSVELDGGVGTMVRDGAWFVFEDEANIPDGEGPVLVVVTNPNPMPLQYVVTVRERRAEEPPSTDMVDEEAQLDAGFQEDRQPSSPSNTGCGCSTSAPPKSTMMGIALGLLVGFRYRYLHQQNSDDGNAIEHNGSQQGHVSK